MKKLFILIIFLSAFQFAKAQFPCATFTATQVATNTYTFNLTSWPPGMIISSNWSFGDGSSSSQFSPTHTYNSSGNYNVCVWIQTMDTMNQIVMTCQACDSISVQPTSGPCMSTLYYNQTSWNTFNFTGIGTGPGAITGYYWDFGDGTNSTLQNPSHMYASSGFYTVCLTVNGVDSLNIPFSCTSCDSLYVIPSITPCNADYMYTQMSGSSFNFFEMSSGPGPITGYAWDFGDGTTSGNQNPTHTYTSSGWYSVCLTVSGYDSINSSMFSCTYCDSLYAQVGGSTNCIADFNYTASSGATFHFTNTSIVTGTITNYFWSFGDGGTSNVANPTHTYTATGNYNVCLTIVVVNQGVTSTCTYCDSTIFAQVSSQPCVVNAAFSSSSVGLNATFTNASNCATCSSMTYNWNFGDGGTSTAANPTHTYTTGGTYNVCLIVIGMDSGAVCTDTICHPITVGLSGIGNLQHGSLVVYPNPTSTQFTVELPTAEVYELNLSDATGRLVIRENVQSLNKKMVMDVSALTSGVYRLTVSNGVKKFATKILKQ